MKFAAPKTYRNIFTPGKLAELAETVMNGTPRKDYKGLSLDELAKLPTIYASIDSKNGENIRNLKDDKVYKTANGNEVLGVDIKAITMVMYQFPRTAYVDFGRVKQVHESMYSGAVPIPMLGYKRFLNIPYDTWRSKFDKAAYINNEFVFVDNEGALETAFAIDLALGHTFASTHYNAATDQIEWQDRWGLLLLSTLDGIGAVPNAEQLHDLRTRGMGNYKGSFASQYGTAAIKDNKKDDHIVTIYNNCTNAMRLLYTQRWAWYGNHRCDDMICDFQNWDNMPRKADTVENVFVGLEPKNSTGLAKKFGIGL